MAVLKEWDEIFYGMSDGDISQYNEIKKVEEGEFYDLLDLYKQKLKSLTERNKKNG